MTEPLGPHVPCPSPEAAASDTGLTVPRRPGAFPAHEASTVPAQPAAFDPFDVATAVSASGGFSRSPATRRSGRGWWVAGVALALVMLSAFVIGLFVFVPETEPPRVRVTSVPPGARVRLDGRDIVGVTPLEISRGLTVGRAHHLEVIMRGYERWTRTFVARDGRVQQSVVLVPLRAVLTVETDPPGAHVWVDDVLHGRAPIHVEGLSVGSRVDLRAVRTGVGTARRSVTISLDDLTPHVVLHLAAAPQP